MENINESEEANSRIYEVGYLLVPTVSEENMPVNCGNLKDLIVSMSGEIIFDEMPKMITLAYAMSKVVQNVRSKFDSAYFGWIKFEINPDKILELKKKLGLDPNIIRFLILKTVRENTIAAKRFIHKDYKRKTSTARKDRQNDSVAPIDREKIDKEIDAMVAV